MDLIDFRFDEEFGIQFDETKDIDTVRDEDVAIQNIILGLEATVVSAFSPPLGPAEREDLRSEAERIARQQPGFDPVDVEIADIDGDGDVTVNMTVSATGQEQFTLTL